MDKPIIKERKERPFKKHLAWLAVILAIQTGILYGINRYFHVDDVTVTSKIPSTSISPSSSEPEEDKGDIRLVGTSFDKHYYAVAYNKRLEVYHPKEEKAVFGVDVPAGMYVSVMHWLPDEPRLLYALANFSRSKSGRIEVHVVDVSSGQDNLVKDINRLSRGSHVKSFALSTLTNLFYLDVENRSKSDTIYQINIMKRIKRISIPSYRIGNIALASKEDLLFIEDKVRHQIFSYNGRLFKMITPDDWDYCLLGITKDDELYIGRMDNGKVTSIFKSDLDGKMNSFADLANGVPRDNISQGLNGQLVIKNFPADNYVDVINSDGSAHTYNPSSPNPFITGDAIFYIQDGSMHITYLE